MSRRLGRYFLLERIGHGGMAEVYAARLEGPNQFQRECVVKILRHELMELPQQVALFMDEARLSAMLQHPCIVQVFDVGESEESGKKEVFFAMERIDGPPLSRLLDVLRAERELMPLEVVAYIGARMAEGLHFAHELVDKQTGKPLHLVHRDVSPQNVLLSTTGEVKVADFGIAKADVEHRPQTRVGITKGKLMYMSPEQARGERVDRRTDVYALGVMLWEMLAGHRLYEDRDQRRRLERAPPRATERRSDVDERLDAIVDGCLRFSSRDRTTSCRDVEDALEDWLIDHGGRTARLALQELLAAHRAALFAADEEGNSTLRHSAPLPPPPVGTPGALPVRITASPDAPTVVKKMPAPAGGDAAPAETDVDGAPLSSVASVAADARANPNDPDGAPELAGTGARVERPFDEPSSSAAPPVVDPRFASLDDELSELDDDKLAAEKTQPGVVLANVDGVPVIVNASSPLFHATLAANAGHAPNAPVTSTPNAAGAPSATSAPSAAGVIAGRAVVPLPDEGASRLPSSSTSFVGRRRELDAIGALFDQGARLVTLYGPGGTGKTRIALKLAEGRARSFPGGAWFVDVTGAKDTPALQSAIARGLGLPLRAGRTTLEAQAMLGHALSALGRVLVVLDNCDDVAGRHGDVIADLMRRAPRVRFLATSQQLLRVVGESALEVQPLAVPSEAGTGDSGRDHVGPSDDVDAAVELFLDRARAARNGRALSEAARGVVAEIVRKLEGVPLAIELAAARAATETPNEILERLGRVGVGTEAQTLKAAIGETWAQLADDEKRAFRQASVFRGGFDADAADAVLDLGDDVNASSAIDVLERLKGRSLIVSRPAPADVGGARFSMLDALRAFAVERCDEAGERGTTEARHAGYYVSLGKRLAPAVFTGAGLVDVDADRRLALETENLTTIVERAAAAPRVSTAAATLAIEAALILDPVLAQRASATEQLALLDRALLVVDGKGVSDRLRLRAHLARGEARRLLGSYDAARADLHSAVDLATAAGDVGSEGRALAALGALAQSQGKLELAESTLQRALALAQQTQPSDDVTAGRALALLGKVARIRGQLTESEERCRRAVEISRGARDIRAAGRALVELASTLLAQRKLDDAASSASAATQILGGIGDRRSLVHAWGTLAIVEVDARRWDDAEAAAARAVDLAVRVGERKAHGLYLGMQGAALHGKGALLDARGLYASAAKALFDVGEDGHGAFFHACLGAVHAVLDDLDAASQAFVVAARRLRTAEKPLLAVAVNVLEGLLGLARAGDAMSRDEAKSEMARRIESATTSTAGPGTRAYDRSEEVRFAVRLVRASLT